MGGVLTIGRSYGPPGFGEDPAHDAKETYPLLTLDSPVCITGGRPPNDDDVNVPSIKAFQLVTTVGKKVDPSFVGKRVTVSGALFHRVSGGHTDVMIMLGAIARAP